MLQRLVKEHSKHGTEDWPRIALEIPKKTATQCRFRWVNTIYPAMLLREKERDTKIDNQTENRVDNQTESLKCRGSYCYKKVTIPQYEGPLGIDVYELPSKKGIEVANVKKTSPLYGMIHRGDTIIQFMETSVHGIKMADFIKIVKDTQHQRRYLIISTPTVKDSSSSSSGPHKQG